MPTLPPPPPSSPSAQRDDELLAALGRIEEHLKAARTYLGLLVFVFLVVPIIAAIIVAASADSF